ncbi:MAG: DUF192 domain-containing protein, partial [Gemmatimonadota bacterium]
LAAACGAGEGEEQATDAANGSPPAATPVQEAGGGDSSRVAPGDLVTIRVGGHEVRVEIAESEEERQRGLMHRESLPQDEGMLFVYPTERRLGFWMRNTLIPLDIAYIDSEGRIVDIQQMAPLDETTRYSRQPAMYALEMNEGWFEAHDVGVGDRVEF